MYNNLYNPYMPTANQSYGTPMSPYYPNVVLPQQPPQNNNNNNIVSIPTINTNKIFVNGIDDVKNRYLQNNSDMIFIDNDKPILYEKKVDAVGKMTIKKFSISEINDDIEIKNVEYVKLSDFEKLKAEFNEYKALQVKTKGDKKNVQEKEL